MDNAVLVKNENHVGSITSAASLFCEDEIGAIRWRTTCVVRGNTKVAVASYSTFWEESKMFQNIC